MSLRQYPEAERTFDRAIQLSPDWAEPWAYKAMLQLIWRGDPGRAHAVMTQALNRVSAGRLAQALTIPDAISGALLTADTTFARTLEAIRPASFDGDSARYHLLLAEAAGFRGDRRGERAHADSALPMLERQLRERADDPKLLARTGLAYARAGRYTDAIHYGRRAAELLPPSRDANSGPYVQTRLAQIYMLAGEHDRALDNLEPLLALPGWLTPALLRTDPTWGPLRGEPRFARLVGSA
jgi:tetratricopeptide (TPR) repeat protein